MSDVLSIAHAPPTTVEKQQTVAEAVSAMVENSVGAVAVVENGRLQGIFTERDLMKKVVAQGKDPGAIPVQDVMTTAVEPLAKDDRPSRALRMMTQRHFRHMPVCDEDGTVLGMLSIRNVLRYSVEKLSDELDTLEAFLSADGPGG